MKKKHTMEQVLALLRSENCELESCSIILVSVEHSGYRQFIAAKAAQGQLMSASVIGSAVYIHERMNVQIIWKLSDCSYHPAYGIQAAHFDYGIEEINIVMPGAILHNGEDSISNADASDALKHFFQKERQEWKFQAMLLPKGLHPSHMSYETEWGVTDMRPVKKMRLKDFIAIAKREDMVLKGSYIANEQDKDSPMLVRGFSVYRIGSEIADICLSLTWALKVRRDDGGELLPEAILLENDGMPCIALSGVILIDGKGNPLSLHQEIVHLLRLVHDRRDWVNAALEAFIASLPRTSVEKNKQGAQLELPFSATAEGVQSYTIKGDNEPAVTFEGVRIARVIKTMSDKANILELYQTQDEQWVCLRHTMFKNSDAKETKICSSPSEVIEFFGFDSDARDLYKQANINS